MLQFAEEKWEIIEGDEDFIVVDESGNTICLVPFYKEGEANANLIVASPDMYEALREICRTYRVEPNGKPEDWDVRGLTGWAVVLNSLAKAEGKGSL